MFFEICCVVVGECIEVILIVELFIFRFVVDGKYVGIYLIVDIFEIINCLLISSLIVCKKIVVFL